MNGIAGVAVGLVVLVAGAASPVAADGADAERTAGNALVVADDSPVTEAVTVPADHRDRDRSAQGDRHDGKGRGHDDRDEYDKDEYDKDRGKGRDHHDKDDKAKNRRCIAEDEAVIGPVCVDVEDVVEDILTVD